MRGKKEPSVRFHYLSPARLPVAVVRRVVLQLFKSARKRVDTVNYIFCDDHYLLEINRKFLNHDYLTDIITFELSDQTEDLRADVYISVERVTENANSLGLPKYHELIRVVLHGALHLVGYNDKTVKQTAKMRAAEEAYLALVLKMFHVKQKRKTSFT